MSDLSVTYTNTRSHLVKFMMRHHLIRSPFKRAMYIIILLLPPIMLLHLFIKNGQINMLVIIELGMVYVILFLMIILYLVVILWNFRGENPALLTSHNVTLTESSVVETTPVSRSEQAWSSVHDIQHNRHFIFLYMQRNAAHVIPRSAFSSPADSNAFLNKAIQSWKLARGKI